MLWLLMPFVDHVTSCVFHLFEIIGVEVRFHLGILVCLLTLLAFQVLPVSLEILKQNVNEGAVSREQGRGERKNKRPHFFPCSLSPAPCSLFGVESLACPSAIFEGIDTEARCI